MYRKKEPPITILERIDITDYVRRFVWYMRDSQGRVFDIRHPGHVKYMAELMNEPENTAFKSVRDAFGDGRQFWHEQKVDFVPSNLKKGYVFYFRCNGCFRRVKYLYQYSMIKPPLCRTCCHLKYEQPNRKTRALFRLLHKPYLTTETKREIIRRAGITAEDILTTQQ